MKKEPRQHTAFPFPESRTRTPSPYLSWRSASKPWLPVSPTATTSAKATTIATASASTAAASHALSVAIGLSLIAIEAALTEVAALAALGRGAPTHSALHSG